MILSCGGIGRRRGEGIASLGGSSGGGSIVVLFASGGGGQEQPFQRDLSEDRAWLTVSPVGRSAASQHNMSAQDWNDQLVASPQLLTYSLEHRIKPRIQETLLTVHFLVLCIFLYDAARCVTLPCTAHAHVCDSV